MFTGIIEATGQLMGSEDRDGDRRLVVGTGKLDMTDCRLGDSIAVNGACLTVVELDGASFTADVSRETLSLTTLGSLVVGRSLNLERALRLGEELGGHLVTGHVDGTGVVASMEPDARSVRMSVEVPDELSRYVARKGSLCVDGVSLTVNSVSGNRAGINLVPHTLAETIMDEYRTGTPVNLEVDLIARYLERMMSASGAQ